MFVLHQHHTPEGAGSQRLDAVKLFQAGSVLQSVDMGQHQRKAHESKHKRSPPLPAILGGEIPPRRNWPVRVRPIFCWNHLSPQLKRLWLQREQNITQMQGLWLFKHRIRRLRYITRQLIEHPQTVWPRWKISMRNKNIQKPRKQLRNVILLYLN